MTNDDLPDIRSLRANLYVLLGRLLAAPPDGRVLELTRSIDPGTADTPLTGALASLATAAETTDVERSADEYQELFVGVGRGELVPYASWYMTGFVGERPLLRLRRDMAQLGATRADGVREHEDHIASLCELMHGIISARFEDDAQLLNENTEARIFHRHLERWAPVFFSDLAARSGYPFYASVGALGRVFMQTETEYLGDVSA